jgi:hypothetical protein
VIRTILLKLGPAFIVTAGFAPGAAIPAGDLFRIDVSPIGSSLFRRAA